MDTTTLIGLGIGGIIVLWLVFSVMRKLFGIVLLLAIAGAAYIFWTQPELFHRTVANLSSFWR